MILLLALGCVPRASRADALMDAGYVQLACGMEATPARTEALLAALQLQVAVEVVPGDAFGIVPRGYGEDHHMVVLAIQRAPDVLPSFDLELEVPGWEVCHACGPEWFLERMATEPPSEPEPTVDSTVNRGAQTALGGLFSAVGAVGSALFEVGRTVGAVTLGTMLLVPDALYTGLLWNQGYRMEITDFLFNVVLPGKAPSYATMTPQVAQSPAGARFEVRSEGPVVTRMVLRGSGVPAHADLRMSWTSGCAGTATAHLPLQGTTFAAALEGALPPSGVVVPLELAP